MTAREKIEELTNAWYGLALMSAVASIVMNGIGLFSLVGTALSLTFSLFVAWFFGGRLLARSSFWRLVLIVLSAVSVPMGAYGAYHLAGAIFSSFTLTNILLFALSLGSTWMSFRSLRVLTDKSVKAYFA